MNFFRNTAFYLLQWYKRGKWFYAARKSAIPKVIGVSARRPDQKKRLFVDVSELMMRDGKTGIQRLVRSVLQEWMIKSPDQFDIQPVYALHGQYLYACQFFSKFFNAPTVQVQDSPIEFQAGDIFLGLDLNYDIVSSCRAFYKQMRRSGVSVQFVVYDLLCIQMPAYFYRFAAEKHHYWLEIVTENDGAICISKAVADELLTWLKKYFPQRLSFFKISWFHLGADIDNSAPTCGMPAGGEVILRQLQECPSFLMVGTLEPRKGHQQALVAFELLWRQNAQVNLIIVGKQGWRIETLIHSLRKHPQLNQRLFWLENASDEFLENIYRKCNCLIAASEGEGFGLPLIEAARHGLPIIARDIPVFHEVTQGHALFFRGKSPEALACAITKWLILFETNSQPSSEKIAWLTWRQSTEQLLSCILAKKLLSGESLH